MSQSALADACGRRIEYLRLSVRVVLTALDADVIERAMQAGGSDHAL